MSEWIDFSRWDECAGMQRPGYAFEVENAEGLSLVTECIVPLTVPFDWKSVPLRFRIVELGKPTHSSPLPAPAGG